MSSSLSVIDRELPGESPSNNGTEATVAEDHGGPGHGAHFTPLNATTSTLIKASSNGDELKAGKANKETTKENTEAAPKTPKKRNAAATTNDESTQPARKRSPVKKATTTTNGDAADPETPCPKKKRASPKKKNAADIIIKTENGETDGETEGPEPVTPKKGKRAPAKGKVAKDATDEGASAETTDKTTSLTKDNGESEGTTVHNTPRKRQAPKKELAAPRGIPASWDDADYADRMLVSMKEKGEGWNEIRAVWKEVTGQDTASSTLPNRYSRIKVNMMRMKQGDEQHLLLAKKDIEDSYKTNFWSNVAMNMERRGADKYPVAFLQKTFTALEAAGNATIISTNDTSANDATTNDATTNDATTNDATTNGNSETNGADENVVMKEEDIGDGDAA